MNIWFLIISFIVGVLCGVFGGAYFALEYQKYGVDEKRDTISKDGEVG